MMSIARERFIIGYCGILTAISAITIDINMPVLDEMAKDFGVMSADMALSITIVVLALGIGQGFWGLASDKFGRKSMVITGLFLYCIGSILCVTVDTFAGLLTARFLQGIGAAVGPVLGRTILRDCYSGIKLAQSMAIATGIFAVGPVFAPILGATIADLSHWTYIFFILSIFAVIMLLATTFLHETITVRHPEALSLAYMHTIITQTLTNRQSRSFLILTTIVWAFFLINLSSIPRFFEHNFGITGKEFALLFAAVGIAIPIGQFINHKLLSYFSPQYIALFAISLMIISTVICSLLVWNDLLTPIFLTLYIVSFSFSYPIILVSASYLTLEPHGQITGGVSSFFGFFNQFFGAIIASIVALFHLDLAPWLMVILFLAVLSASHLLYYLIKK